MPASYQTNANDFLYSLAVMAAHGQLKSQGSWDTDTVVSNTAANYESYCQRDASGYVARNFHSFEHALNTLAEIDPAAEGIRRKITEKIGQLTELHGWKTYENAKENLERVLN